MSLGLQIYEWVSRFARKLAAKPSAEGIMTISNKKEIRDLSNEILTKFMKYNVPKEAIKSENDVKVIYNQIRGMEDQSLKSRVISPGDPRHKEMTDRILGKSRTTADLIDLGLVRKGKNVKKTTPKEAVDPKLVEEVKVKETFDDANKRLTETDVVADTVTRVVSMEPVEAMKEANKIIGRKGIYKNLTKEQSQKILKDTDDWIFQRDPDDLYDYNKKRPFRDDADPEDFAYGGVAGLLGERTGYFTGALADTKKGKRMSPGTSARKINLDKIIGNVVGEREPPQLREDFTGQRGLMGLGRSGGLREVLDIQEEAKTSEEDETSPDEENLTLGLLSYILENSDQQLRENMLVTLGEGVVNISALTTMSGFKHDAIEKAGFIAVDGKTLYQAVIDTNLFGKYNLNATAIANAVGTQELMGSLKYNDLGLTWNSETGQMDGEWKIKKQEGPANKHTKWSFTPAVKKNDIENSQEASLAFDKAINSGDIHFKVSDEGNSGEGQKTLKFKWTGKNTKDAEGKEIKGTAETIDISHITRDGDKTVKFDGVKSFDFYDIEGSKPTFSLSSTHNLDKGDENYLATAMLPLPYDFSAYGKKSSDNESSYGIGFTPSWEIDNWFTKDKSGDNKGIFSIEADKNLASGDWGAMFNFRMPLSKNKLREKPVKNFNTNEITPSAIENYVWKNNQLVFMPEKDQLEYNWSQDSKPSWSADTAEEAWGIYKDEPWIPRDRMMMPPPRMFADGGIARLGFKDGHSAGRRKFLKLAAGLASIPVVGKFFKWAKPAAKVADLTSVPIKNIKDMPLWFKPLVNKVIKEGEDLSGKLSTVERQLVHAAELPGSKTKVFVTQDLNTGDVIVDIGMGKHGWSAGHHGQPVRLEYKAAEWIEPPIIKEGKVAGHGKGVKTKEEFWVEEAEFTGGHPENVKFEESTFEKFGQHGSNFDEIERFATGKIKKKKPLKKRERTEWESGKAEADAERWSDEAAERGHWVDDRVPEPDDFASGGLARMLGE